MTNYFNDNPIESSADDSYGVTPFAELIARTILKMVAPAGTTIALHGPWGSGKSSAVNLIRNALADAKDDNLVITEFKGWWYRGEEALALAFLQDLHATLIKGLGEKVKLFIPQLTRRMLQAGPVVGFATSIMTGQPLLAGLFSKGSEFAGRFFSDNKTLEETFAKLADVLRAGDKRFLIVIDDIDRLYPDEALAVFRLVKSVGRLPNVMYLLAFDRELAENLVLKRYPSEGPHFLEKIIQAGFELPAPVQTDLNDAVLASIVEICGPPKDEVVRTMNVFYDIVAPYITTPRHVVRFQNAISVTWPAIADEVNLADFIALETLRLYEVGLFKAIRAFRDDLCGIRQTDDPNKRDNTRFDKFLVAVPENRRELAKLAVQRLFPRQEDMGYGGEWISIWSSERRICVETYFETYFRLTLSDEALSIRQIQELIDRADDPEFVKETLQQAALTKRKNGTSMVPIYLDELTTHASRVERANVEKLISTLFEIHDEIDCEEDADKGVIAIANTTLRFHWLIRRLTRDRFSIEDRTALYMMAIKGAAVGWLVDFVSSAREDYSDDEDKGPKTDDSKLVTKDSLASLTARALAAIQAASEDGRLINHRDLAFILYRWRDFLDGDPAIVRAWTDSLLQDDQAVVKLARAMTGRSWSMGIGGMGSLGDRVARASTTAQITDDTNILDVRAFRAALERVRDDATLEGDATDAVRTFLEAWDRKGRD